MIMEKPLFGLCRPIVTQVSPDLNRDRWIPGDRPKPPTFAGDAVKLFDIVLTMHGLMSFDEERKALSTPIFAVIDIAARPEVYCQRS
jgi:hypothetical protein